MKEDNLRDLIDISSKLDSAILEGIKKGRVEKNKQKNRIVKKGFIAASFALFLVGGVITFNPEIVSAIPGVNKVFKGFNSALFGESTEKFKPFIKEVGVSVEDKGIVVNLNELVFDDNNLILALEIKGDSLRGFEGNNYSDFIQISEYLFINGEEVSANSSPTKVSEDTAQIILKANIAQMDIKNDSNIELKIESIGRGKENIDGQWIIKTSTEKLVGKKIEKNDSFNSELGTFIVKKVSMTELSSNIFIQGQYVNEESFYKTNLMIKDIDGRVLPFEVLQNSCDKNKNFERHIEIKENLNGIEKIFISDVNGAKSINKVIDGITHELIQFNGSRDMSFEEKVLSRKATLEEIKAGYIGTDVNAYVNINEKNHKNLNELIGDKIYVSNDASIEILEIKDTLDGTKFKFKIEGYYDYKNLSSLTVVDENMNFITRREGQRGAAIEDAKENIYSMSIDKIDKNKKYVVGVRKVTDLEESKLNMEINLK
ncbi:MAG: DUF4179 domain-containing protein [Sarcina sp.]